MPRSFHPFRKGNVAFLLVMIRNATLSPQKKAVGRNGSGWAGSATQFALLANLHDCCFLPSILLAGHVRVDGYKLEKASHARDVTEVVSAILAETASYCQQFERQFRPCQPVAFFAELFCKKSFDLFCYASICRVSRRRTSGRRCPFHVKIARVWGLGTATTNIDRDFGKLSGTWKRNQSSRS